MMHDITLAPAPLEAANSKLVATIQCERRGTLNVDVCRACERFERIEMHEGGFVMLCRSVDESFDADE